MKRSSHNTEGTSEELLGSISDDASGTTSKKKCPSNDDSIFPCCNTFESGEDDPWVYRSERLKHLDFPLGGFGTGNLLLKGDGTLDGWNILNQFHSAEYTPLHSLPSLCNEIDGTAANCWAISAAFDDDIDMDPSFSRPSYVLRSANRFDNTEPTAVETSVPPSVPSLQVKAQYPIATISYKTPPSFPLSNVRMEAMTPLVPTATKESSYPMAIFTISFENNHPSKTVSVDVMQSTLNFIGWDGTSPRESANTNVLLWGGNINKSFTHTTQPPDPRRASERTASGEPFDAFSCTGLFLYNHNDLKKDIKRKGSTALSAIHRKETHDKSISSVPPTTIGLIQGAASSNEIFRRFQTRDFDDPPQSAEESSQTDPSDPGTTYIGAVVQSISRLPPQTKGSFTFCLSWHFPYRICTAPRSTLPADFFGNKYSDWFQHAQDVVCQLTDALSSKPQNVLELTRLYVRTLYSSTIPWEILESAAGRLAVARSPTMFWTETGVILGNDANDRGPLNCTHVYGYTTLLERLFPDLAKDMRNSDFIRTFDLSVGGCTARFGEGGFAIDGALASIIKTYLVVLQSDPSLEFLKTIWPNLKRQMEDIFTKHIEKKEGVIRVLQQNTYETAMQGANTFIGSYLITALKATAAMGVLVGDVNFSKKCQRQAEASAEKYEGLCWSEDFGYYIADVNETNCENSYGPGCFIDQLAATGLSGACGLGSIFHPDHEARARRAIVRNNSVKCPPFRDMQSHFFDGDAGLKVCTYPNGKLGKGMPREDLVASGLSYSLVAGLIMDGNWQDALMVCRKIRARQSGIHRSPWNEPESGLYSARSMAAWNIYDQACGFLYNATSASIAFRPRINETSFSCFCTFHKGFGRFQQTAEDSDFSSGTAVFEVLYGSTQLKTFRFQTKAHVVNVSLDDNVVQASIDANGIVTFDARISMQEGSLLTFTLTSPCNSAKGASGRPTRTIDKEKKCWWQNSVSSGTIFWILLILVFAITCMFFHNCEWNDFVSILLESLRKWK